MRWLWASALGLALAACGGGGGDSGSGSEAPGQGGGTPTSPTPTQPGGGTSTGFNGTLSGLVVYSAAGGSYLLDLQNGGRAAFPLNHEFYPSLDGRELAGIDTSTRATTGNDRVQMMNLSAGTNDSFTVPRSLQGMARLSPDRQLIAARWQNEAAGETQPVLTVFNRQGQVVARHSTAGAFAWMPNGRLLMAQNTLLVTADANGTSPTTITTLPGAPLDVAPSRDGARIAVTLPAGSQSHVWVMDASGANLRQLTNSGTNERNPEWSTDNQWVVVRQNVTGAAGSCPLAYAVPVSATSAVMLGGADAAPAVRLRFKGTGDAATDICPTSPIGWMR